MDNRQRNILILAAIVLVGYAGFTWWMASQVHESEVTWSRLVFLYQGVEAIVFAAAGFLFGREVQRGRTAAAEEKAVAAAGSAALNQADAEAGRAVIAAIDASGRRAGPPPVRGPGIGAAPGEGAPTVGESRHVDPESAQYLREVWNQAKENLKTGKEKPE